MPPDYIHPKDPEYDVQSHDENPDEDCMPPGHIPDEDVQIVYEDHPDYWEQSEPSQSSSSDDDEDKSSTTSDSGSEADSEKSDMFNVRLSTTKDWTTPLDRYEEKVRALSKHMRRFPLLPPHPEDFTQSYTDVCRYQISKIPLCLQWLWLSTYI